MSKAASSGDAPAKKRGKLPLIIGVVVLLAGAGGGYVWWSRQQAVSAQASATEAHGESKGSHAASGEAGHGGKGAPEGGALLPLESFTVNLADTEATRYLRTNVQLVIDAEEDVVKELEEEKLPVMRTRSAVLEILAQQTAAVINTPDGKAALKKAIAEKASTALHHEVLDVLFSDFVIQF